MKRILLLMLLVPVFAVAQKAEKKEGFYSAYLYAVDAPKGVTSKIDSVTSIYEDENIKIDWDYTSTQFQFDLKNKLDQTIKVIWDEAAYISLTNETGRVFHKGVKYIDREASQPATAIYKGTTLSDLVAPSALVSFVSGQYGGWRESPMIPVTQRSKKVPYLDYLLGKTMKVVLPIKVDDKTLEYIFSFKTQFVETKK